MKAVEKGNSPEKLSWDETSMLANEIMKHVFSLFIEKDVSVADGLSILSLVFLRSMRSSHVTTETAQEVLANMAAGYELDGENK